MGQHGGLPARLCRPSRDLHRRVQPAARFRAHHDASRKTCSRTGKCPTFASIATESWCANPTGCRADRSQPYSGARFRLGAGSNSNHAAVGKLLTQLSERCPEVEVVLKHGTSLEILTGIRNGSLDAGFYNEGGEPDPELTTLEVSRFSTFLVGPPGRIDVAAPLDWKALAELAWIYPTSSACCGQTAESLFKTHHIRPRRIISVDREAVTRTLIAGGLGIGLLHADTAREAQARGEVDLLFESEILVRVLFAHLTSRAQDPLLAAATAIMRAQAQVVASAARYRPRP
jgi:DNA-binding transcriptional LysR family regulator